MCFVLALTLPLQTRGQQAENKGATSEAEGATVGRYLDRFLKNATVAADAAKVVTEAEKYRREADRLLIGGQREEARQLLRRVGEVIAAAAPDRDAKRDDPFLREYLREITAALVKLEQRTIRSDLPTDIAGDFGRGMRASDLTNPRVAAFRDHWLGRGRGRLNIGRDRLAEYHSMMARVFREEGVPEWLLAIGFVESTYNPSALSPASALGIWQFIPGTGMRYGLQRTAWTDERQHPEKSTRAAARYLRDLHALFGDWPLALAGYNWGENRVARVIRQTGIRDFWTMAARGLLPQETANYVPSVLAASQLLGGFSDVGAERAAGKKAKTRRSMAATNAPSPASAGLSKETSIQIR